jgi:hypothetical protein|tara:strand:+ start:116 stop:268 length:153 start_codon:yes stop_codon:yes gene_type:complete
MANTKGEKELKTDWPSEDGLSGGTQKQTGRVINLQYENSIVPRREKIGFD